MPANQGFELQDGDVQVIGFVNQLRAATLHDHLVPLTGRSKKALRARLLKLRHRRYVTPVPRFLQQHVFVLGPEAASVLIEAGFAPQAIASRRMRDHELKPMTIQHLLFVRPFSPN